MATFGRDKLNVEKTDKHKSQKTTLYIGFSAFIFVVLYRTKVHFEV